MDAQKKLLELQKNADLLQIDPTTGKRYLKLSHDNYEHLGLMQYCLIDAIKQIADGLANHNDLNTETSGFTIVHLATLLQETALYNEFEVLDNLKGYE